jgi:aspartate/glutamate racemase
MPKFLVQNRDQLKFKNQDDLNERIKLEINQKKLEAKTEVLNSLGVNIIDIECNTSEKRYFEFYDKVIEKLKRV